MLGTCQAITVRWLATKDGPNTANKNSKSVLPTGGTQNNVGRVSLAPVPVMLARPWKLAILGGNALRGWNLQRSRVGAKRLAWIRHRIRKRHLNTASTVRRKQVTRRMKLIQQRCAWPHGSACSSNRSNLRPSERTQPLERFAYWCCTDKAVYRMKFTTSWFREASVFSNLNNSCPGTLGRIQTMVEIQKEDVTYAECKAFILNVDASAADPARTQACANIMSVIERARADRQAHADLQQDRAQREAELEEFRRQRELDRQMVEQQARRAEQLERRRAIGEAIRSMTAPPPQSTTRCSFYGSNANCTTTSY